VTGYSQAARRAGAAPELGPSGVLLSNWLRKALARMTMLAAVRFGRLVLNDLAARNDS
jgi:hypothetical protein